MRLCRIEVARVPHWGVIDGELVTLLATPPWQGSDRLGGALPLATAKLLPPCEPSKIVAVGLNFRAHAAEMGSPLPTEPVLFLKAPSSLLPPGGAVVLPKQSKRVEYEGELALVIGKTAAHVAAGYALEHVLGYTCLDDVSARDIQKRERIYARAKGFDTFCPVGPWLETEIADPQTLDIELRLNGVRKQKGNSADMIFTIAEVVAFVSDIMTLYPGDLITTGTPPGVGPLASGDQVEVEISSIGVLRHTVA
jgi:2-keto-4-pentenoate hydratase/2-oxohepta-3-ene-1,7-dioic acid hydratase in catechol pathway